MGEDGLDSDSACQISPFSVSDLFDGCNLDLVYKNSLISHGIWL